MFIIFFVFSTVDGLTFPSRYRPAPTGSGESGEYGSDRGHSNDSANFPDIHNSSVQPQQSESTNTLITFNTDSDSTLIHPNAGGSNSYGAAH